MNTISRPRLDFNFPRVLIQGCGSFVEYRFCNDGLEPLENVQLMVDCPALGLTDSVSFVGNVSSGECRLGHIDVVPQLIGAHVARVQVAATCGRQSTVTRGTCTAVLVYEKPESISSVSVVIQDIQSHRSQADKAEFGGMKGDVSISVSDLLPQVHTVNDLIKLQLPDYFLPVELNEDLASRKELLCIPRPFLNMAQPAASIALQPVGQVGTDDQPSGWRLHSSRTSSLLFGRSSLDCDVPTRFVPNSPENATRSQLLSRKHVRLHLTPEGLLEVENVSSGGLVFADQEAIACGQRARLNGGSLLILGHKPGEMQMAISMQPPSPKPWPGIANFADWIGSTHIQTTEVSTNWGRVEVAFINSRPTFWHTLWFSRSLSFGSSPEAGFCLHGAELDPIHGYFHHFSNQFWLENASSEGGGVTANGIAVGHGELVPLVGNLKLSIGGCDLDVRWLS